MQSNKPTISIIVTTYNRFTYLLKLINSILKQTFTNFELIIWDDGSNDPNYFKNLHKYVKDNRIKIISEEHQGRVKSLSEAFKLAQGIYLTWVDDDDLLYPTALADSYYFLRENELDLCYSNYEVINFKGDVLSIGSRSKIPYSYKKLLTDFMIFHFRFFTREIYDKIGGIDTNFKYAQDYDFCLKVSEIGKIAYLDKILYQYRVHPSQISNKNKAEQAQYSFKAVQDSLVRTKLNADYYLDFRYQFLLVPINKN